MGEKNDKNNKPKFHSSRFDEEEEEHKIQYRSMAAAIATPMDPFLQHSSRNMMHGHINAAAAAAAPPPPPPMMMMMRMTGGPKHQGTTKKTATMVDSTNYSMAVPRILPVTPFRLEPQTHFFVSGSVQRICSVLGRALAESGSDFIFRESKCKWKTDYYDHAQRTHLNIVMFKTKDKGHVIELQRRQGDVVAFMGLYWLLYQACTRQQLIKNPKPMTLMRKKTVMKSVQPKDMMMVVMPICAMLRSKYQDIQYQAIQAIISLSNEEVCRKALSVTVVDLLKLCQIEKCQPIALAALSKLSSDVDCRRRIMVTQDWKNLLHFIVTKSTARESKRTSMEVLADLCTDYGSELAQASNQTVVSFLNSCESIPDLRMRQSALRARTVLSTTHGFTFN